MREPEVRVRLGKEVTCKVILQRASEEQTDRQAHLGEREGSLTSAECALRAGHRSAGFDSRASV